MLAPFAQADLVTRDVILGPLGPGSRLSAAVLNVSLQELTRSEEVQQLHPPCIILAAVCVMFQALGQQR